MIFWNLGKKPWLSWNVNVIYVLITVWLLVLSLQCCFQSRITVASWCQQPEAESFHNGERAVKQCIKTEQQWEYKENTRAETGETGSWLEEVWIATGMSKRIIYMCIDKKSEICVCYYLLFRWYKAVGLVTWCTFLTASYPPVHPTLASLATLPSVSPNSYS